MANEFTCLTHYLPCVNGTSPNQIGVQLFAESSIVLLFGLFFAAQSLSRVFKNRKSTKVPSTLHSADNDHYVGTMVNSGEAMETKS